LSGQGAADDLQRAASRSGEQEALDLFARLRNGERSAFEALYRRYRPRLSRFLLSLTRRRQIIEEVLDDTMMVVWSRPETFSGASRLSTWIFAIAYRKMLKALRRIDEPIDDAGAESRASLDPAPDQQLDRDRLHDLLLAAMDKLSPNQRAVVDLTYFHEMSYRDIAEIMDCPEETVKTRMFHARRHLRRILAGNLEDLL
jgi:RNA polymerase sigma-70 factor (ECF subfamily)